MFWEYGAILGDHGWGQIGAEARLGARDSAQGVCLVWDGRIPDSRWDTRLWIGYQIGVGYQVGFQSGLHSHLTPLGSMKH